MESMPLFFQGLLFQFSDITTRKFCTLARMKKTNLLFPILVMFFVSSFMTACAQKSKTGTITEEDRSRKEYIESMDILSNVIGNVRLYFVDTVSINQMTRRGIDAMLGGLDPYTEYIPYEEMDDLKLITTGEYAGIGAIIAQRPDSSVIIQRPIEGMPADETGLIAGDKILKIDGKDFRKTTTPKVSEALKGISGTTVKVTIMRYGEKKPRTFAVKRRKVIMNSVPYSGIVAPSIGYIRLNNFTDKSAEEVRLALLNLRDKQNAKSLILDLRGNGGGLMQAAIEIVNLFTPKDQEVVTTKGRSPESVSVFRTLAEPLDTKIPLVVLIDGQSASSSEIVAGALQDMDRAVLMGQKSYGKGLVQTTRQMPYNGVIKLTTAKYYIPSGRCIQRLDYSQANKTGLVTAIPDSLHKVFHTAAGRPVEDAGGILPDIEIKQDTIATLLYYMAFNNDVFDFVTDYYLNHKTISEPESFSITEADYMAFCKKMEEKNFDYDRQSAKILNKLEEMAKIEGYLPDANAELKALREKLKPNLSRDLKRFKKEIIKYLNNEIVTRYYYERGSIRQSLPEDKVVNEAIKLLQDNKGRIKKILQAQPI